MCQALPYTLDIVDLSRYLKNLILQKKIKKEMDFFGENFNNWFCVFCQCESWP
jgi:hypothetical protein